MSATAEDQELCADGAMSVKQAEVFHRPVAVEALRLNGLRSIEIREDRQEPADSEARLATAHRRGTDRLLRFSGPATGTGPLLIRAGRKRKRPPDESDGRGVCPRGGRSAGGHLQLYRTPREVRTPLAGRIEVGR